MQLNYKGNIKSTFNGSKKYGPGRDGKYFIPVAISYDKDSNLTTVEFEAEDNG